MRAMSDSKNISIFSESLQMLVHSMQNSAIYTHTLVKMWAANKVIQFFFVISFLTIKVGRDVFNCIQMNFLGGFLLR